MGTMRSEVYDTLHPLLEQLVDITCNHIEALESENGSFNIDMILEQRSEEPPFWFIMGVAASRSTWSASAVGVV